MDNVTEVGQKMRSAIKAKLIELNCYVDDELPDYIMVMVANRRSKEQMVKDLQLFLTDNTTLFVNWLHQVLKKLEEVTVSSAEKAKVARQEERLKRKIAKVDASQLKSSAHPNSEDDLPKKPKHAKSEGHKKEKMVKSERSNNVPSSKSEGIKNVSNVKGIERENPRQIPSKNPPSIAKSREIEKNRRDMSDDSGSKSAESDDSDGDFINLKADGNLLKQVNASNKSAQIRVKKEKSDAKRKLDKSVVNKRSYTPTKLSTNASQLVETGADTHQEKENPRKNSTVKNSTKSPQHEATDTERQSNQTERRDQMKAKDSENNVNSLQEKPKHARITFHVDDNKTNAKSDTSKNESVLKNERRDSRERFRFGRDNDRNRPYNPFYRGRSRSNDRFRRSPSHDKRSGDFRGRFDSNRSKDRFDRNPRNRSLNRRSNLLSINRSRNRSKGPVLERSRDRSRNHSNDKRTGLMSQVVPVSRSKRSATPVRRSLTSVVRVEQRPVRNGPVNQKILLKAVEEAQKSVIKDAPRERRHSERSDAKDEPSERDLSRKNGRKSTTGVSVSKENSVIYQRKVEVNRNVSVNSRKDERRSETVTTTTTIPKQRFIVTLDGVDENMFRKKFHESSDETSSTSSESDTESDNSPKIKQEKDSDVESKAKKEKHKTKPVKLLKKIKQEKISRNVEIIPLNAAKENGTDQGDDGGDLKGKKPEITSKVEKIKNIRDDSVHVKKSSPKDGGKIADQRKLTGKMEKISKFNNDRRRSPHEDSGRSRSVSPKSGTRSISLETERNRIIEEMHRRIAEKQRRKINTMDANKKKPVKDVRREARVAEFTSHRSRSKSPKESRERGNRVNASYRSRSKSPIHESYRLRSKSPRDKTQVVAHRSRSRSKSPRSRPGNRENHRSGSRGKDRSNDDRRRSSSLNRANKRNEQGVKDRKDSKPTGRRTPSECEFSFSDSSSDDNIRITSSVKRKVRERGSPYKTDGSRHRKTSDGHEEGTSSRKLRLRSHSTHRDYPPLTFSKKKERCKYWPACKQTEATCEYVHPSTMCKLFPNCKFGMDCLFLHPNCKYDTSCSHLECHFSHGIATYVEKVMKKEAMMVSGMPRIVGSQSQVCKFFPNCSNGNCHFFHPVKPCRFGLSCINVECSYLHLAKHTQHKMW